MVLERTVDVHVARIREKLRAADFAITKWNGVAAGNIDRRTILFLGRFRKRTA